MKKKSYIFAEQTSIKINISLIIYCQMDEVKSLEYNTNKVLRTMHAQY